MAKVKTVVKVGGSLLGWPGLPPRLSDYLKTLDHDATVLVAGGGRAADFLRELDSTHGIGEKRSHGLALIALDLTAHALAAVVPGLLVVDRPADLPAATARGRTPVLSPRWFLENNDRRSADPLAESWDVTTDSIAARLAVFLGADELVLLKSSGLGTATTRDEAARAGLVDPAFPETSATIRRLAFLNLRGDPPTVERLDLV